MDFSMIIGLVVGMAGLLGGFLLEGGSIIQLIAPSPIIIVFGGTIGSVFSSFAIGDIIKAFKAFLGSFASKAMGNPNIVIEKLATISDICRREGLLKIEDALKDPEIDKDEFLFMKEGLMLVLEGRAEEEIRFVLESDIQSFALQKHLEIGVFEAAGGFAPTMGVIGTVMSLVIVLSHMGNDSSALAESIATAFIATLYGVSSANIAYLPIAQKLKANLKRQQLQREMIMDGVCMIARGEASRNITNTLSLYWQAFPGGDKKYKEGINN